MNVSATLRQGSKARVRLALMGSLAVAALLAGCETPPPPPPPPPVAVVPPPPPVLLPRAVVELASIYEGNVAKAVAIDPSTFSAGASVAESLKAGEGFETGQFQQGQTAYGAVVALQDPTFVASLREFAKDPEQRSKIANQLMADPNYAATFKGADSAAGLVISALSGHGQKLLATGERIHLAAYDVQHQNWSKADVEDRPGRLALAKALSTAPQQAIELDTLRLAKNADGTSPMGLAAMPVPPPYTPLVARALAVAAMAALGEGGEEYSPQLTALLVDPGEGQCLKLAKLNLYQCLAVAKPHYEDVFCLGQHAVAETGQCVMKSTVVGYQPPAPPPKATPEPEKKPVAKKKSVKKKAPTKS